MTLAFLTLLSGLVLAQVPEATSTEVVGERPYEMVWANRTVDDHAPLVDFENLDGWTVECKNAVATLTRSREQQVWGSYVGKLVYRGTGTNPEVRLVPPQPIATRGAFDTVTMWIYGNNWAYSTDPTTPQVQVSAVFADTRGREFTVDITRVNWREWFLGHRRMTPDQIEQARQGASFKAIAITGGRNTGDRVLYLDNLAAFVEAFPPLKFDPRPERGIPMFPGETVGTNTGPGKLPFPTRLQTILPPNLVKDFSTSLSQEGKAFVFTYQGADGTLTYRFQPQTGMLEDVSAQWTGRGGVIKPCVGGGVYLLTQTGTTEAPDKAEQLSTVRKGDTVVSSWRLSKGAVSAEVTYTYRLWNKSLVVDVVAPGGNVSEVRYGQAQGLESPRVVTIPYYRLSGRPAVAVSGSAQAPLFLAGATDWYLSGASELLGSNAVTDTGVTYNGGTRYLNKTDGKRNDCYERLFLTLSPRFEEVLPTIDNPVSPWKQVTGTKLWRAHGAGNRQADMEYWTRVHRYGMTEVIITDHETMWRDGGESFTFRTRTAPKKGGEEGARAYSRFLQDKLGFVYGPYNNFTDFAPVNEYWSTDLIGRRPDAQLQSAWARCYGPKPSRAVEYCAKLSPINQEKYGFSTAYCDVHTAVSPWSRTDYDARVPGAGTSAATFYAYGEIMLLQKAAWRGPVYSEGGYHFLYCGLTDGNYGQDQEARLPWSPWLVDFDLLRMHDLCCNFGMGNPGMFYGRDAGLGKTAEEIDASVDRFLAATVAFGHPGFLTLDGGMQNALRSYYMLQQLHSRYCLASAETIRYADAAGNLLDTSAAVASGAYQRSQVVTRYSDGTVTVVNGSPTDRMKVDAYGKSLDLPPNGYAGWTEDGKIEVLSSDGSGTRSDYAVTPAYLYADGRGRFTRHPKAASDGIGICRILGQGKWEIIPYKGAECGFAIPAVSAVALNQEGAPIGPAQVRTSRGLAYVVPVEGAFSYEVTGGAVSTGTALQSERDQVVPGEQVTVRGREAHQVQIPTDARVGQRIWQQLEGAWIDFTVVPMADADLWLEGNRLMVRLSSNLPQAEAFEVSAEGKTATATLTPRTPQVTALDLGEPKGETSQVLQVELRAGQRRQVIERGMRVDSRCLPVVDLPAKWRGGMCLRGGEEQADFGQTRGYVDTRKTSSGGVTKTGIFMHPPYMGGTGYSYALYDPIRLPDKPAALFRAVVGKGDGSDLGDGILYKVVVVDEAKVSHEVGRTLVDRHAWLPIEGDLSAWAGKTVQIKLVSDVGDADDSSGDWACWAEMRIETRDPSLVRTLSDSVEPFRRAVGPYPVAGLTQKDLQTAKRGWVHYDGKGLSGTGEDWGSFGDLNGCELGNLQPAGGNESAGVFQENLSVPLTAEALQSLKMRNQFQIRNPRGDSFSIRRFWVELELADGRRCSSLISTATYTQPVDWLYAEGIRVPRDENITVDIEFAP